MGPNEEGMISEGRGGQKCAVGKDAQFYYWIQNEEGRISSSEEEGRGGHKCTRVGKTRAVRHLSSVAPIPSIQMVAPWFSPNLEARANGALSAVKCFHSFGKLKI